MGKLAEEENIKKNLKIKKKKFYPDILDLIRTYRQDEGNLKISKYQNVKR